MADRKSAAGQGPRKALRVRATRMGYYEHLRRREGDVFTLKDESHFSESWMEAVDARTPERTTSAPEDLRRQHDEILKSRAPIAEDGNPLGA